jgi:hypothetical protein
MRVSIPAAIAIPAYITLGSPSVSVNHGAPQGGRPPPPRITIGVGSSVTVDGVISPGEWGDADTVLIEVPSGSLVAVHFKHDGTSLLFAFTGFDQPLRHVPEVLIDVGNGKEGVWGAGHWWFHASATDCWSSGRYNAYDTCVPEAPVWEASNARHSQELFELRIPFSTVGLEPGEGEIIGIAFDVTGTQRFWYMWPRGAQLGIPSSWGEAVIATGGSS